MPTTIARLQPEQRNQVLALIGEIERVDGVSPLSENKAMRLEGRLDARELVAVTDDGLVVGYSQAAWHRGVNGSAGHWAIEVAVLPEQRVGETAVKLIDSMHQDIGDSAMTLWARVGYVGAAAAACGWTTHRTLWEMRRSLPVPGLTSAVSGFRLATFRMGADENAWLDANNAAFAGHPENGQMTRRDLEHRMAQTWFDPDGFFVAWDGTEVAGSCWTKVHENGTGEIYVIGVAPAWEGRGLGRALVVYGLDYLHNQRHVTTAVLFVEASNVRATRLYEGLGFEVVRSVHAYRYAAAA